MCPASAGAGGRQLGLPSRHAVGEEVQPSAPAPTGAPPSCCSSAPSSVRPVALPCVLLLPDPACKMGPFAPTLLMLLPPLLMLVLYGCWQARGRVGYQYELHHRSGEQNSSELGNGGPRGGAARWRARHKGLTLSTEVITAFSPSPAVFPPSLPALSFASSTFVPALPSLLPPPFPI